MLRFVFNSVLAVYVCPNRDRFSLFSPRLRPLLRYTLVEFENVALFLRAVRPSVQSNPSRNGRFSKMLFKPDFFLLCVLASFSVVRKCFEYEAFRKRLPCLSFLQIESNPE